MTWATVMPLLITDIYFLLAEYIYLWDQTIILHFPESPLQNQFHSGTGNDIIPTQMFGIQGLSTREGEAKLFFIAVDK